MNYFNRFYKKNSYSYTIHFCHSIELFVGKYKIKDKGALFFQGIDFENVFKKSFYFSHYNNTKIFSVYNNRLYKKIKEFDFDLISEKILEELSRVGRTEIAEYEKLLFHGKAAISCEETINFKDSKNFRIYIHAIHPKFLLYLKPIIENWKADISILESKYFVKPVKEGLFREDLKVKNIVSKDITLKFGNIFDYIGNFPEMLINYIEFFKREKPDLILTIEGNSPQDEIMNLVCQIYKIPCINIQHGWAPIIHNGFRNLNYSKMFVWGDIFGKILQPFNQLQQFELFQNPSLIKNTMNTDEKTKKSGLIFFFQTITNFITEEIMANFIELIIWTSKKYPTKNIFIKEHPSYPLIEENIKKFKNLSNIICVNQNFSLTNILNHVEISVSIYSTTIIESVIMGVETIIFNETSLPKFYPDLSFSGITTEVKTLFDAKELIKLKVR